MKNKAATFLKQIINTLTGMAKAKTLELKRKTRAFKTRLVIFSLLHDSSLSHKLKGFMGHVRELKSHGEELETAAAVYNAISSSSSCNPVHMEYKMEGQEEDKYRGSVIEMAKHSKEDKGEEFRLEEEIDRVADLFISRFHRQMWLQKQLSLESRHQDQDTDPDLDETHPPAS